MIHRLRGFLLGILLALALPAWASRSFDGDNDVLTATAVVLDSTTTETTQISVVTWLKRSHTSFGTEETVWVNGAAGTGNHLHTLVINTDNTLTIRARTTANSQCTTSGTIADTTTWHMVVTKVVSTTAMSISIDGGTFTDCTGLTARDPTTATDTFRFGGTLAATPVNEYSGLLGWSAAYRSGVTQGNVTSLWNSGAGADPSTVGSPVAVWDMSGNESPEVNNITPGTYDLTLLGGGTNPSGLTFSSDNPFGGVGVTGIILKRRRH